MPGRSEVLNRSYLGYNPTISSNFSMHSLRRRSPIRPKISTMPRVKTEASMQLELYKLATEKQRIQNELKLLELRQQQLQERIGVVSQQIVEVEKETLELRRSSTTTRVQSKRPPKPTRVEKNVDTFYLEY